MRIPKFRSRWTARYIGAAIESGRRSEVQAQKKENDRIELVSKCRPAEKKRRREAMGLADARKTTAAASERSAR